MALKLKKDLEEAYIYVPFINNSVVGKFIDEGLYQHLYGIAPELFEEEVAVKKTKVANDLYINDAVKPSSPDAGGTHTV
jgi:hypothetical protein